MLPCGCVVESNTYPVDHCASCGRKLPSCYFSRNQWKKGETGHGRCKECLAAERAARDFGARTINPRSPHWEHWESYTSTGESCTVGKARCVGERVALYDLKGNVSDMNGKEGIVIEIDDINRWYVISGLYWIVRVTAANFRDLSTVPWRPKPQLDPYFPALAAMKDENLQLKGSLAEQERIYTRLQSQVAEVLNENHVLRDEVSQLKSALDARNRLLHEMQGRDLNNLRHARLKQLKKELRQAWNLVEEELEQRPDPGLPHWQWQSPDGTFVDYEPQVSQKIESHLASGCVEPLVVQNGGVQVQIYLEPTTEQEVVGGSGKRRLIRSAEALQEPSWTPQTSPIQIVDVDAETSDYAKVLNCMFGRFDGSLSGGYSFVSAKRVQNRYLKGLYDTERGNLLAYRGSTFLNEKTLFHGSSKTHPLGIVSGKEGLMLEYARPGFYGQALYFADQPRYSHSRAHWTDEADGTRHYHVIICRVLCGKMRRMGEDIDRSMTRLSLPPEDYDSVEGGPHQPNHRGDGPDASLMYVIYQAAQVYPEFVVTYRARRASEQHAPAPVQAS